MASSPASLTSRQPHWPPVHDPTIDGKCLDPLPTAGRAYEVFEHGVKPEWGYSAPQRDSFILIHPAVERPAAPLHVVLHSAGHDVIECVRCASDAAFSRGRR